VSQHFSRVIRKQVTVLPLQMKLFDLTVYCGVIRKLSAVWGIYVASLRTTLFLTCGWVSCMQLRNVILNGNLILESVDVTVHVEAFLCPVFWLPRGLIRFSSFTDLVQPQRSYVLVTLCIRDVRTTGWDCISELRPRTDPFFISQMIHECGKPQWNCTDRVKPNNSLRNVLWRTRIYRIGTHRIM
jgi:hypothetical protein